MKLTKTRIRAGVWEGVLSGAAAAPQSRCCIWGEALAGISLTAMPERAGECAVRVPIPAEALIGRRADLPDPRQGQR